MRSTESQFWVKKSKLHFFLQICILQPEYILLNTQDWTLRQPVPNLLQRKSMYNDDKNGKGESRVFFTPFLSHPLV